MFDKAALTDSLPNFYAILVIVSGCEVSTPPPLIKPRCLRLCRRVRFNTMTCIYFRFSRSLLLQSSLRERRAQIIMPSVEIHFT